MVDVLALQDALALVFTPWTLMWLAIGVTVGVGVGAMPGLYSSTAIALLLPLTFTMDIAGALGLLIGVYKGATFGGSISAISFATPGTPESAACMADGHTLMKRGKGKKALHMALYASVTGDVISDIITIILAPLLAIVALQFGPPERLWLMILAIALLGTLSGDHFAKGLLSAALGLFVGTIGADPVSSVPRNTFGQWWLADGIQLVPLVIGIFAMGSMLARLVEMMHERHADRIEEVRLKYDPNEKGLTFREYRAAWKELAIGTTTGSFVGILPGLGGTVGAFLSFGLAQQASPSKKIGTGRLEGVAAAEAGNSATVGPTLVPLIAFGIPGSANAALIGGALALHGVIAGPRVFDIYPSVIYALFLILIVGNVLNLVLGRGLAGVYARLGRLPGSVIVPSVMVMALVGTYAARGNVFDVVVMLVFGLVGFLMRLFKVPEAPLVIAFLLAPIAEESLRRALLINRGDWGAALFGSTLAISLAAVTLGFTVLLVALRSIRRSPPVAALAQGEGQADTKREDSSS